MGGFAWQLNGIDEAGYGPRLGPLVQACAQLGFDRAEPFDFEDAEVVVAQVATVSAQVVAAARAAGVRVGDSKALYASGGAAGLWGSVAALGGDGGEPDCAGAVPGWLAVQEARHAAGEHPSAGLDFAALQADGTAERVTPVAWPGRLTAGAWCLYPGEFNAWTGTRNKAEINWELTRRLVTGAVGPAGPVRTVWTLDRQGGRKRYGGHLSELFAPAFVRVVQETSDMAVYRVQGGAQGAPGRGTDAWVVVKVEGEQWSVATGLASMIAKSLREAAMARFNAHFSGRHSALRPTAGYPTDAERWRKALLELQPEAGFDWAQVWRCK